MKTIGLMAAMPQESNALLCCIEGWKPIAVGLLPGYQFTLSGQECVLVTSGMGFRRAGQAARELVALTDLRGLISFGIAGAVGLDLEIGDVILAEAVCRLDQGLLGSSMPLACWPDAARAAVIQALDKRGARLWAGTAVTTRGARVNESQLVGMKHPILEMETAGIAQAAAEKGIPLFSLRAISDGPRAPIPFDLGQVMDEDANLQAGKLLKAVIRNPRIILQSRRMMHNTQIAADHAALALIAALSHAAFGQPQDELV
jgi:adenosylhomocysteine nucleosidase